MKKGTVVNRERCYFGRIPLDCLPGLNALGCVQTSRHHPGAKASACKRRRVARTFADSLP